MDLEGEWGGEAQAGGFEGRRMGRHMKVQCAVGAGCFDVDKHTHRNYSIHDPISRHGTVLVLQSVPGGLT